MERGLSSMSELTTKIISMDFKQDAGFCEIHNTPRQNTGGKYNLSFCKLCGDEKRARYETVQQKTLLIEKQKMFDKMLAASCIPKRFMGSSFENFITTTDEQKRVLSDAVQIASGQDLTGAILIGVPGTGKTHLAAAIGIEFIKKGKSCLYTKLFNMVLSIKESWRGGGISESDMIKQYTTKDLLIIDEVGVQFGTPTEILYVTNIIDDRYNNFLPTIFIGNITPKELRGLVGDRAMRRILEKCKTLVFSWKQNPNNPPKVD